jgi:hypothetical protein
MQQIAEQYGLRLGGKWNREMLPQAGNHPPEYHEWVLSRMQWVDNLAAGDQKRFLELFDTYVKKPVRENPQMLKWSYWR